VVSGEGQGGELGVADLDALGVWRSPVKGVNVGNVGRVGPSGGCCVPWPGCGRAVKWTAEKVGVPACGVGFSSQPLDFPVSVSPADLGPEKR